MREQENPFNRARVASAIPRFWVKSIDGSAELRPAFGWLVKNTKPGQTALLLVHALSVADETTNIGARIGADAAKALGKGKAVPCGDGSLKLITPKREAPYDWSGGPVLVAWAMQDLLDIADTLTRASAILAVSWHDDSDLDGWIKTWNVPELGTATPTKKAIVSNYVVENALEEVISSVNIADGGGHPSDHASIVQMFRLLRKHNESFEPQEVRAWLISTKQMQPRHAERIADIAMKIRDGRSVQTRSQYTMSDEAIVRWRKR